MNKLKVGDVVPCWGFNISKLKWWEKMYLYPRWQFNDFCYWLRKRGQSLRDGFPSEESFDFYSACAKWSLPRIKQLRDNLSGHPCFLSEEADNLDATNQYYFDFIKDVTVNKDGFEKWKEILDKIIWSMENFDKEPDPIYPPNYDDRMVVTAVTEYGTSFNNVDERKIDWTPVHNHEKRVQEGFELFGKHFRSLWD